jgi:hypothetical protein
MVIQQKSVVAGAAVAHVVHGAGLEAQADGRVVVLRRHDAREVAHLEVNPFSASGWQRT